MPRLGVLPALLLAWALALAGLPRDATVEDLPPADDLVPGKKPASVTVTRRRRPDDPEGMTAAQIIADVRKASSGRRRLEGEPEGRRLQDMLDLKDTFVENAEKTREIDSINGAECHFTGCSYCACGSANGGTRLHIDGTGFATEFFSGKNKVFIGDDSRGWVACDVVEGACTVDCGGDKRIVCDTRAWTSDTTVGWLDVKVEVDDTISTYDLVKTNCFYYLSSTYVDSMNGGLPRLTHIYPRHAAAGSGIALRGHHLGRYVSEYRTIYIGAGRPPQGGNIQVESGFVKEERSTHALCRADDLNFAVNDKTGEVDSFSLPVLVEDAVLGHNSPITENAVNCYLGDFASGSYNASAHMSSTDGLTAMSDGSNRYGGLTFERFTDLSRDAYGEVYAFQYYPHVSRVMPAVGSLEGGTLITISGGGFSDDETQVSVSIGGRDCEVLRSTLVEVVCRTGDLSSVDEGLPQDHHVELGSLEPPVTPAPTQDHSWTVVAADAVQKEGLWSTVSTYMEAPACGVPPCTPSWLVLAPSDVDVDGSYEVTLTTPGDVACTTGDAYVASQASVLVADAARGYVPLNVSLTEPSIVLGTFSFAAGPGDGRRGAVIVDTVGADGCVPIISVAAVRVGPMAGGDCADPLAANYVAGSSTTCDCVYVGGRGLRQRAWSLMAPDYRDGSWLKDEDKHDAYATGRSCNAPDNASQTNFSSFHGICSNPRNPKLPLIPEVGLPIETIVATPPTETAAPTAGGLDPTLLDPPGGTTTPLTPVAGLTTSSITNVDPDTPILAMPAGDTLAAGPITSPLVEASISDTLTGEVLVEPVETINPLTGVTETKEAAPILVGIDTIEPEPLEPLAPISSLVSSSSLSNDGLSMRRRLTEEDDDGVCLPPVKPKTGRIEAPVVPAEAAEAFCCLSSDWHGCEATWNLADKDGFVDVLRQDAKMCAPFTVDELRRSCYSCLGFDAPGAHQPVCHCCSRLDELEFMRTLSDGRLELKLEWPGTLLDFMHWKQRMNPAQFDLKTRSEQYEWNTTATEAEDYEAIHAPYFEANYWGGLEYGGTYSLLDGSYNREHDWWYAVGSFENSQNNNIPSTTGDEFVGDATADTWVRRATLKAKPDYTYFQPKCISCEACYDSDGYWRGETTTETWQNTTACTLGQACAFDRIVKTTVPGCPAICRGMRIRAFEARAAHHTLIVRDRYSSNTTAGGNCTGNCTAVDVINTHDIGAVPAYRPGAGSFEGFFVAPKAASYVFVGVWDAALELSLSSTSDPRHLQVILGGATQTPPSDNDVVGDWTFYNQSWYFASTETKTWADAQAACQAEGATLAEINSPGEQDFLYGLCDGVSSSQCWLGGSGSLPAGMWRWQSTGELFAVGLGDTVAAAPDAYTNWHSGEPNNNGQPNWKSEQPCVAMYAYAEGVWDDNYCTYGLPYLCESALHRAKSSAVSLAAGEARYFELLHVHNSSVNGGYLGLELEIDGVSTRVGGTHSLSMEFFRVKTTEALPVVVSVGAAAQQLASASLGSYAYAKEATPTITDVFPRRGAAGQLISIEGTLFSDVVGEVEVGIGGATCDVSHVNHTVIECTLRRGEATAGRYPVDVRVVGVGFARHVNKTRSTYEIPLKIHDFAPRNGSVMGGDIIRIWGEGFSRLGPQNYVTVAGVPCTPRTLKNFHCRVSRYDSGFECAATSTKGYELVWNAHAPSRDRANSEWLDYSSTTYIECVLDDLKQNASLSGPVTVQLLRERDLHDEGAVYQNYTKATKLQLEQATRNMDCFVLKGYRIWNWGLELQDLHDQTKFTPVKDCILYDEDYDQQGTFMMGANFSGVKASSSQVYTLVDENTPVILEMDSLGMAGQELTIRGKNFDAAIQEWDYHWRMDEFGFYTQPESPVVYIGGSPTVLTFANSTMVKLLPTYNLHDQSWPVTMHVRGRGLAKGNRSFVYVNYLYSVSPSQGSLAGGTRLTLRGSGFTTDHTFYSDEASGSVDMGTSLADYTIRLPGSASEIECGLHMTTCMEARDCSLHPDTCGSLCDVVSASKYEIVCDTRPANDISVDQTKVIDMQVDWNYEPFYFQCASQTCTPPGCVLPAANASACEFSYAAANTPRLVYEPPSYIAAGDVVTFALRHRTESPVADFDWFTAGEGPRPRPGDLRLGGPDDLALTMTVTLGEAACTQIKIDEQYDELTCLLDEDAAPETDAVPRVFVEGYGNAEIRDDDDTLNPTVDILPRVTSFTPTMGSLAGGTTLHVRGAGFGAGTLVILGVTTCSDVVVTNASYLTCVTDAVPTASKSAVVSSAVTAHVVDASMAYQESTCASTRCVYTFAGNDTRYTPVAHNTSSKGGAVYADRERLVIQGAGFAPSGKTVKIGAWACPVKWETPSEVACDPPRLPAGVHVVRVHVPNKGYALGYKLWYRSPFVLDTQTLSGSIYGGQSIVLTGAGFPDCAEHADRSLDTCADALKYPCAWDEHAGALSFSYSGSVFEADVVKSEYDRLHAIVNLRSLIGASASTASGTLTVDVNPLVDAVDVGAGGEVDLNSQMYVDMDDAYVCDKCVNSYGGDGAYTFDSWTSTSKYWDVRFPTAQAPLVFDLGACEVEVIDESECPADADLAKLKNCDDVAIGALCEGDGECGTTNSLDNCDAQDGNVYDVYRRVAGTPKAVTKYTTATSASNCAGWTFAGSEDGIVWDDLDSYARAPNGVTEALNMTSGEIENATVCLPADRKGNGAAQTVTRTIEGGLYRYYRWLFDAGAILAVQPTSLDDGYFLQVHDVSLSTESFSGSVTHERTSSSTPAVTAIVQDAPGRFRSIVEIQGLNFGGATGVGVTIGGLPCPVMTANDTRITCASPNASAGAHAVVVTAPAGIAGPAKPLAYEVGLYADNRTRATPERGSLAGGTYITMVGDGFAEALDDNKVTIAGADCEVVEFFEDFHESLQPTAYPSVPPTPAPTMLPSHSTLPTPAPSFAPTAVPSSMPSSIPSTVPTALPSALPTPAPSRLPSSMPSFVPTAVPTAEPTLPPSAAPTYTTVAPSPTPTTALPSAQPTSAPTPSPTYNTDFPSPSPTTGDPTAVPTSAPSHSPTMLTELPTPEPTLATMHPSAAPTSKPSAAPAPAPTIPAPSAAPTFATELPTPLSWPPTPLPSTRPSSLPSSAPTTPPTAAPSSAPSAAPFGRPTKEPTPMPAPAPTPRPVALSPTRVPTAAPSRVPTAAPSGVPTAFDASRKPTYVPTALPSGEPSVPPTSRPSSTPTSPAPTPKATLFTGFNYRSTLTCVTGPLPANATYAGGVSARPRVRTRLRTGTTLIVRAGTSGTGSGFVATQSEAGCRFRDSLWAPASSSSYRIFFGFYNAQTRSLEDYYETGNGLTATKSAAAAAFIESYEARDDLIFVVTMSRNVWIYWEPTLPAALKRCGATNALHKMPASDGSWISGHYLLVSQCGKGVAWASQHGLEASNTDSNTALEMEVDIDAKFELYNGDAHAGFNFTYAPELTPTLQSVSRLNGSTAGGTTLRLNVTGIRRGLATVENTTVTLGGVVCAIQLSDVATYRDQHLCEWDGVNCNNLGIEFHNDTNTTMITCLTNAWDYSGDAREAEILVSLWPWGHARNPNQITWAYVDLWSSLTTWGGKLENKPLEGDSVVITQGQYIVLDESPPALHLLLVYGGVLEFSRDVGDLALNASYIFVFGGKLVVGTEQEPFPNKATITLTGDRDSYELPVYGAKCLAVRDAILDLHGLPQRPWTRLSQSVHALNDTIYVQDPVDWQVGDRIFITSTSFDPMETEERTIAWTDGYSIKLDQRLFFFHHGDGYFDDRGVEVVPEYRAEVGLLSRNVVVQGDDQSKQQQFGGQIVFASSQLYDDSIIGRLSNIETRNVGQGLKLGKYPIHFHMVGNVSKSYVKNCTVHHANNRAIAIHGVNHLTVSWNVVFDTRGHAVFIEDGTEVRNTLSYNLVALVRPIWSLLLVDQSPACYWIVNPDNDVYGNVAAASSHYGFWYRQLEKPDGISGQSAAEQNVKQFPIYTPLARMEGNVAHSTKRHGLKVSDYFPTVGGADTNTFGEPATFRDFLGWNNGRFGVWGEFLVDVNFDGLRVLNPGIAGLEFLYMNGRGTEFAKSTISNTYFVGRTREIATAGPGDMCEGLQDVNGAVNHDGNGCIHALHLPGIGSELLVKNATFVNFEAPLWTCSWCVGIKGGYEVDFENVTYTNVTRPATFKKGFGGDIATSGILNDLDGSLGSGAPGGVVAPYAGHFANNPDCVIGYDVFDKDLGMPEYVKCTSTIRRVSFSAKWTSAKTNTLRLYKFPHIRIVDVTDWKPSTNYRSFWDELPYWHVQSGDQSCVEQAPQGVYLFLLATGREYALIFRDQLGIPVTAKGEIYAAKMKPTERIVIHLNQKAPFQAAHRYGEVTQKSMSRWGENTVNIGWEPSPPAVPGYSIGSADSQPCALNEFSRCGSDGLHQMPQVTKAIDVHTSDLEQVAGARESRGAWLRPASGGSSVVCDSSGSYVEGSQLAFCELTSSNYEELRWRHGFDGDFGVFKFFEARGGWGTTWNPGAPNGTMTISNIIAPMYCWDIEHDLSGERLSDDEASAIELRWCEEKDETGYQDWEWISTSEGGKLRNAILQKCAGLVDDCAARAVSADDCPSSTPSKNCENVATGELCEGDGECGTDPDLDNCNGQDVYRALQKPLVLVDCADALVFESSWLDFTPLDQARHGLFHFDRTQGPPGYEPDAVTWTNETNGNWDWWYPMGLIPYDVTNISTMSFLMAGNSTLEIETSLCGPEGCPVTLPVCRSCGTRSFKWTTGDSDQDFANWNVTNDPSVDVPSDYWEGTIWDDWTVTIDQDTPVVNRLVVRGTLIFEYDAGIDITLHAHYITVDGGNIIMGNASHPINNETTATVALHGDKYLSTKKINGAWSKVYNFKRLDLNGNLTMYGRPTVATWRKLGAHAFIGQKHLNLSDSIDWDVGDEILLSSSKHHGAGGHGDASSPAKVYASHIIRDVSSDGRTLYLDSALTQDYVGEVVMIDDKDVDVRAVVALRRWNVRILGADTTKYDRVAGLTSWQTGWGASVRALDARKAAKPGWSAYMPLYDEMGTEHLPTGHITIKHGARFERCGKGYMQGSPQDMASWDGVAAIPCLIYSQEQEHADFVGAHAVTPFGGAAKVEWGNFLGQGEAPSTEIVSATLNFRWNVFWGENFAFAGGHTVEDNVFLGGTPTTDRDNGSGCPIGLCPGAYIVRLVDGDGQLSYSRNYVQGAMWAAVAIYGRKCAGFSSFNDNVAVGSWIGYRIQDGGCNSLDLRAHRNSVGLIVDSDEVSNFIGAENGIGLAPIATPWQFGGHKAGGGMKNFDLHADLHEVKNSTFVGVLLDLQRAGLDECVDWTGVKASHKDWNVYFRDWDYLGIARGGYGGENGARLTYGVALPDAKLDVYDCSFVAYSSPKDSCVTSWTKNQVPTGSRREGVAFGNEAAALGHGSGEVCLSLGNAQCYPLHTRSLSWIDTPYDGRMAFSPGTGGQSGLENDQDFGACTHFDEDGSLYDTTDGSVLYKADVARTWPEDILEDCQAYSINYDDDTAFSKCPWFIRANDYLLDAANDASRRGYATHSQALDLDVGKCSLSIPDPDASPLPPPRSGSRPCSDSSDCWKKKWGCNQDGAVCDCVQDPCQPLVNVSSNRRVQTCTKDFVTLKFTNPLKITSGSEVLFAPVAISTVRRETMCSEAYFQDDTVVAVLPNYPVDSEKAQFLDRWPSPYVFSVPNGGIYHIDYTGDVTAFSAEGDYGFQLLGTGSRAPVGDTDFAVIVTVKFLQPCKLLFYVNGRKVNGGVRRTDVTLARENGFGFQHATTKIAAVVLKGSEEVRMQALQVVQVSLAIAVDFDAFFADNLIDPAAIDNEFADLVPPDYAADYDPNGGNIVKQDPFVRNLASVLMIDPARIKVTNIVPGNRRRLREGRRLLEDDGLEVEWQLQEIDLCDGSEECNYGMCSPSTGLCVCTGNYGGPFCNITGGRRLQETSNATNSSTSNFDELMNAVSTLEEKADSGQLDVGVPVLGMLVTKPLDVCGVEGGNGTSCLDACGVANGDGTSCVDTPAPTMAPPSEFTECGIASSTTGSSEKQEVWLKASDLDTSTSSGFKGTFTLSFGGSTTSPLAVFASASDIEQALKDLDTVRDEGVTVTGLLVNGTTAAFSQSVALSATEVRFGVEFPSSILKGEAVQNVGDLPLVSVDSSSLTGDFDTTTITETCAGSYRIGYEYAEQTVTLSSSTALADLDGSFKLALKGNNSCGNGTSLDIPATATAAQVAAALTDGLGEGLFKGVLGEGRIEVWGSDGSFTVRLYTLDGEDLTGCSGQGAFDAFVPINDFTQTTTITVNVVEKGRVPASAMPVDLAQVAAEAAAAAATVAEPKVMEAVKPLVVVCGDGIYLTAEDCDDGNRVDGDGCSANCTVESGFVCTKPVSRTSVCTLPQKATIQFKDTSSRVVREGNSTSIVIERIGDNTTSCNVDYSTMDSTARHLPRENSNYVAGGLAAEAGDFKWANGTLAFGAGEVQKTVTLQALEDQTFDGDINEVFLLRLSSTSCEGGFVGEATVLDVYVYIIDSDVAPSAMPTPLPSAMPTTAQPSAVPTLYPSVVCPTGQYLFRLWAEAAAAWTVEQSGTPVKSGTLTEAAVDFRDWVCLADGSYDVGVTGLDSEAHWRLDDVRGNSAVSKGPQSLQLTSTNGDLGGFPTFKPTLSKQPTAVPTAAPSSLPSSRPSYIPTPVPTTSVPTSAPSQVPSPMPSTAVPSSVPVPRPTALPTAFPSWDNCNKVNGSEIDRSTLYRYDASVAGVAYTVQEAVASGESYTRGEVIYTRTTNDGGLASKGHFCLEDGCYYLDLSGDTVVDLRSSTDKGPKFSGAGSYFFCVEDGVYDRYPSAAPTISAVPTTARPSHVPIPAPTSKPSEVPIPAPTTKHAPTIAPTTTDLALKISSSVDMASSDTAADIMASEDKQLVLKEGLAACSEYTRADMITLTSVAQASSRRRRLSTNNLVVEFDIIVVAEAYGFDAGDLQQLFDLVKTNLTQHINDGSFNDAVVEAATDLGVTITVTADPQVMSISYIDITIPTPDWFTGTPTADPTAAPSISPKPTAQPTTASPTKEPEDLYWGMGFWGFLVVCVLIGFTSAFLVVYGLGKLVIYMKWHHHLLHPNKAARVADASQLTTEELEATLRERGLQEAADAFAAATRKRDEPAGPLPPRMMAHARTWADRHRRGRLPPVHPVSTDDEERPVPTLRPSTPADLQNLSEDEVAGLLRQTAGQRGLRRLRAAGHTVRAQLPPMPERNLVSGGRPSRNRERATANLAKLRGAARATAAFARAGGESSGADDELESPGARMYRRSVAQADDLGHMSISQLKRVARERRVDVSGCLDKADFIEALDVPEPRTRSPSRERSPGRPRRVVRRGQARDRTSNVQAMVERTLRRAEEGP